MMATNQASASIAVPTNFENNGQVETQTARRQRFNLNLSAEAYDDMASLAKRTSRTMTELVRLALGLLYIAYEEVLQGNKLLVADAKGNVIRELVLPK